MKINIAKIVRPLDLGGYAEELKGQVVMVCVNPDHATIRRRELLIAEYNRKLSAMKNPPQVTEKNREAVAEKYKALMDEFTEFANGDFSRGIHEWFAQLWSHGAPETHWTVDELDELNKADPALYQWMKNNTIQMIEDHRSREKKG